MARDRETRLSSTCNHTGEARSSPYPTSRLAPAFNGGDLAEAVAQAESMLSVRTGSKLRVIADQIQALQREARKVLEQASEEHALNQARCAFKRIPGKTYHLYRGRGGDGAYFSMLSPADWGGQALDEHLGSYRLESDYSWSPADGVCDRDDIGTMVDGLLRIGEIPEAQPGEAGTKA